MNILKGTMNMVIKVLSTALLFLVELNVINCQWYGGYDAGQYAQQYVIINPYGSGYDDVYSQFSSYPYNDPQFYSSYAQPNQYSAQPIVIIVNNERDIDCDIDDFLSLLFPFEDKCTKEPVYVPYPVPVVVDSYDRCECGCKKCECPCRCECSRCDSCNKCKCKDDCQCKKKKERNNKTKCKCNECQQHSSCGGLYHKM